MSTGAGHAHPITTASYRRSLRRRAGKEFLCIGACPGRHNRQYQQPLNDYIDSLAIGRLTAASAGEVLDDTVAAHLSNLIARRERAHLGTEKFLLGPETRSIHHGSHRNTSTADIEVFDADIRNTVKRDPVTALLRTGVAIEMCWCTIDAQWRAAVIDSLMRVTILPLDCHRQSRQLDVERIAVDRRR